MFCACTVPLSTDYALVFARFQRVLVIVSTLIHGHVERVEGVLRVLPHLFRLIMFDFTNYSAVCPVIVLAWCGISRGLSRDLASLSCDVLAFCSRLRLISAWLSGDCVCGLAVVRATWPSF